jgi:hypothetical protein
MARKIKIELNRRGVGELLKSRDMEQGLATIASQHSGGWSVETKVMPTRVIAAIYSEDPEEISEELENHGIVGGL